jgi:hypothetical protein
MAEKVEIFSWSSTCLYIIVSHYTVVVGITSVTCLTARDISDFKFLISFIYTHLATDLYVKTALFIAVI